MKKIILFGMFFIAHAQVIKTSTSPLQPRDTKTEKSATSADNAYTVTRNIKLKTPNDLLSNKINFRIPPILLDDTPQDLESFCLNALSEIPNLRQSNYVKIEFIKLGLLKQYSIFWELKDPITDKRLPYQMAVTQRLERYTDSHRCPSSDTPFFELYPTKDSQNVAQQISEKFLSLLTSPYFKDHHAILTIAGQIVLGQQSGSVGCYSTNNFSTPKRIVVHSYDGNNPPSTFDY